MKKLVLSFSIIMLSCIAAKAQSGFVAYANSLGSDYINQQSHEEKQYYETEARAHYKIDISGKKIEESYNITPLKTKVVIERGKITIGQTIYYLGTSGSKRIVPSGDIAYDYWGHSDEYNDIGIQVNYSIDTKRATMIYISLFNLGIAYAYSLKLN